MTEPLARALFVYTLDDRVDVSWRAARHSPSVQRLWRRGRLLSTALVAMLAPLLLHTFAPNVPTIAVIAATVIGCIGMFVVWNERIGSRYRRLVRRMLREAHGEGHHQCDVALHADRLLVRQDEGLLSFPWPEVDSVRDDDGDIELLSPRGAVVVRGRAFANETERAAFLRLACKLVDDAKRGA